MLPPSPRRWDVAESLARMSGLRTPTRPGTRETLVAVIAALQSEVIDHPALPMDRAVVADTALSHGCLAVGSEVAAELFQELGRDALDKNVRDALATTIASGLAERGVIRLIGR
jgi:hypothetical protein